MCVDRRAVVRRNRVRRSTGAPPENVSPRHGWQAKAGRLSGLAPHENADPGRVAEISTGGAEISTLLDLADRGDLAFACKINRLWLRGPRHLCAFLAALAATTLRRTEIEHALDRLDLVPEDRP